MAPLPPVLRSLLRCKSFVLLLGTPLALLPLPLLVPGQVGPQPAHGADLGGGG